MATINQDLQYINEHSARVKDAAEFEQKSFRRKKLKGDTISIVLGSLKGKGPIAIHSYRFPIEDFTVAQSVRWLKDHDIKWTSLTPAKGHGSNKINSPEREDTEVEINQPGLQRANLLIDKGKIDIINLWGFSEENKTTENDWSNYSSHHIARDTGAKQNTQDHYKYRICKDGIISRRNVIAAKVRAEALGESAIVKAADELLEAIDKKIGKSDSIGAATGELVANNMRIDYDQSHMEEYLEEPFKETPEGFLKGRAIFTNIGVFPYLLENGSIRNELRLPEEVFNEESMKSFQMLPMTNDHPMEDINKENIKQYQVGYTGENVRSSPYHLSIPIVITDPETIDACKVSGKRALSGAYTTDIEMRSGVWMGVAYDAIQRNIRGNHIAVVDRGRAGDDAVMKFDSIGYLIQNDDSQNKNSYRRENMKKIKRDGVEYEADQKIIDLLVDAEKDSAKIKADSEALRIDNIKLEAERDQLKEEVENLKTAKNDEAIEKAVQERMVVLDAAKRAKVDVKADMSEGDIKKAVVLALYPKMADKLSKCDRAYLDVSFDLAAEKLDELDEQSERTNSALSGDSLSQTQESKSDANVAYLRMIERNKEAWKTRKEVS